MERREVRTQQELDEALGAGARPVLLGTGRFEARGSAHVEARGSAHVEARGSAHVVAWDSAHVEAWDSVHVVAWGSVHVEARDSAHVEARDSAHVVARGSAHVVAWDSAHVEARDSAHVEARDSAHVEARGSAHVEAWGSAHVVAWDSAHVVAWDSAHVEAWDSAHVEARSALAVLIRRSTGVVARGGIVVDAYEQTTDPRAWCRAVGLSITRGKVVMFKRVGEDWTTRAPAGEREPLAYVPGTTVVAPDWDPEPECGMGLHLCPTPAQCDQFRSDGRYVALRVTLADIVVHATPDFPDKVKARSVKVLYECDRDGNRVDA